LSDVGTDNHRRCFYSWNSYFYNGTTTSAAITQLLNFSISQLLLQLLVQQVQIQRVLLQQHQLLRDF